MHALEWVSAISVLGQVFVLYAMDTTAMLRVVIAIIQEDARIARVKEHALYVKVKDINN